MKIQSRIKFLIISTILLLGISSCMLKHRISDVGKQKHDESAFIDGPIIINTNNSEVEIYTALVSKDTVVVHKTLQSRNVKITCEVDNEFRDKFSFKLNNNIGINKAEIPAVEKIFVMSDLHGSFNAMSSLLIQNGVIDKNYKWKFGKGHLVMVGDITDRGRNTIPCLWLFYKLEQENPGKVHYILGNHELMTLYGRETYLHDKTQSTITQITGKPSKSESLKTLFSDTTELGKWLRTKNTIEKIGDIIFVHGGLSTTLTKSELSIDQINNIVRKYVDYNSRDIPEADTMAKMLFGRMGPLWYRGMVQDYGKHYKKITEKDFDKVLSYFKANKVIIGHTEVDSISTDYNNHLIKVNVHQPWKKNSKEAQALLIKNNTYYRVNAKGERIEL